MRYMVKVFRIIGAISLLYCGYEIINAIIHIVIGVTDQMLPIRLIIGYFIFYISSEQNKKLDKLKQKHEKLN